VNIVDSKTLQELFGAVHSYILDTNDDGERVLQFDVLAEQVTVSALARLAELAGSERISLLPEGALTTVQVLPEQPDPALCPDCGIRVYKDGYCQCPDKMQALVSALREEVDSLHEELELYRAGAAEAEATATFESMEPCYCCEVRKMLEEYRQRDASRPVCGCQDCKKGG